MAFRDEYDALEREFCQRAMKEGSSSWTLSIPKGRVDFVLVAMEPSTGGKDDTQEYPCKETVHSRSNHWLNFAYSFEDYIVHYTVEKYLCAEGEGYYLTDLAKGWMPVKCAERDRTERWEEWFPLLKQELQLVANRQASIVAVGRDVEKFLIKKMNDLPKGLTLRSRILHYSQNAVSYRTKKAEMHPERYGEFSKTVSFKDIEETIRRVEKRESKEKDGSGIASKPNEWKKEGLTESRKNLMFTYFVQFAEIREAAGLPPI